jgi:carboxyl-terminal processing protease
VVRVRDGSPAESVGIRPGWRLLAVEGHDVSVLPPGVGGPMAAAGMSPERIRALYLPMVALGLLQGSSGDAVEAEFEDEAGIRRILAVDRASPAGQLVRFGNLPPLAVEVEDAPLALPDGGTAAWIRFSAWFPAVVPEVSAAVDRWRSAGGIILDLRGNPGGLGGMAMGVGGHFLDEPLELGEMRTRDTTLRFVVNPQRVNAAGARVEPYAGPLAILVDPLTASTSEIFAAGLQALGRARIFGETTAGQALPAVIVPLPNGDRLMHVIADYTAPGGVRLEGRGVIPDETVTPTRAALAEGRDPALEAALAWIAAQGGDPSLP